MSVSSCLISFRSLFRGISTQVSSGHLEPALASVLHVITYHLTRELVLDLLPIHSHARFVAFSNKRQHDKFLDPPTSIFSSANAPANLLRELALETTMSL